jgi:hypothetical protein
LRFPTERQTQWFWAKLPVNWSGVVASGSGNQGFVRRTSKHGRAHAFNANLGIAASQDDASLQAIIPWGPKEAA